MVHALAAVPALRRIHPVFAPKSPPTLEDWEHQQMIVETTFCARENVRMR
jgi:hypothetical protein